MSVNSKAKGARVERKAVEFLRSLGFIARRTQQYAGNTGDAADVVIENVNLHPEVKGVKAMGLGTQLLADACDQAERDSKGRPWVVLWWEHAKGWRMTYRGPSPNGGDDEQRTLDRPEDIAAYIEFFRTNKEAA